MRIALAQINPTVGDIRGNTARILEALQRAGDESADLLVCPELSIIGYPPRDLLLREGVVEACEQAVRLIARRAVGITVIAGHPRRAEGGLRGIRNSASICREGEVIAVADKRLLPGYDIFDEDRYFDPGETPCVVDLPEGRIGVLICEDLWRASDVTALSRYEADPIADVLAMHAEILIAINASPFILGKYERHLHHVRTVATQSGRPVVMVNQVGGNDDLIFDGRSMIAGPPGRPMVVLPAWSEAMDVREVQPARRDSASALHTDGLPSHPAIPDPMDELFHALVLGVHDYCGKTGRGRVIIGLSGGVDSAVTATIAAAALGAENILGIMMPSRYSSPGSIDDARALARGLGIQQLEKIGIEPAHSVMEQLLEPVLGEGIGGITDENVQSRLRGMILMACSNATGALVLSTGNKSELAMGYSTLYGDMSGAVAVLGDVVKTSVYRLARWINANHRECGFDGPPIPEASITKEPSAELRPGQRDQDTLPPYEVLDEIIERWVEQEHAAEEIASATGLDEDLIQRTVCSIDIAEYKRNQAALILKVTSRTFGRGRPMPIVMRSTSAPAVKAEKGRGGEGERGRQGAKVTP